MHLQRNHLYYLACPYSDPSPYVRHRRFLEINRIAGHLFTNGFYVFSPISHTHPIKEHSGLAGDWEFWGGYDTVVIARCDGLIVATFEGWGNSVGVRAELQLANELKKPLFCIDPESLKIHVYGSKYTLS